MKENVYLFYSVYFYGTRYIYNIHLNYKFYNLLKGYFIIWVLHPKIVIIYVRMCIGFIIIYTNEFSKKYGFNENSKNYEKGMIILVNCG